MPMDYDENIAALEPPPRIHAAFRGSFTGVRCSTNIGPFFAGRVTLTQQVQLPAISSNLCLAIDHLAAALVQVKVNGRPAGAAAWPPHQVQIAEYARVGENTIEIELVGTLRNLLGPHHLAGGDPARTNPEEFRDKTRWTDDYILTPFGWDQVRLIW